MEDLISRRTIIDGLEFVIEHGIETDGAHSISAEKMLEFVRELPSIQSEPHEIGYDDCANALLKMWIDNVLTDGEYYRIADKLNEKWGKIEISESYNKETT